MSVYSQTSQTSRLSTTSAWRDRHISVGKVCRDNLFHESLVFQFLRGDGDRRHLLAGIVDTIGFERILDTSRHGPAEDKGFEKLFLDGI